MEGIEGGRKLLGGLYKDRIEWEKYKFSNNSSFSEVSESFYSTLQYLNYIKI